MGAEIQLIDVSVAFGQQVVLDRLNLVVPAGAIVAVVGLSGCGKTTLLKAISGQLEHPSVRFSGQMLLNGYDAATAVKTLEVAMCFQRPFLFPWLRTKANISLNHRLHSDSANDEDLSTILDAFGLTDAAEKFPSELSGGMAQRVALAREFARKPDILLLDEPFANLDCVTRDQLNDHLLRFARQLGTTVVIVTHDPDEAVYIADRVAVLQNGRFTNSAQESKLSGVRTSDLRFTPEFRNAVEWVTNRLKNSESVPP